MFEILKIVAGIIIVAWIIYVLTQSIRRTLEVATGLAIYESFNALYDMILWPYIQAKYMLLGIILLTIGAGIINLILLQIYRISKIDWLGTEEFEKFVEYSMKLKAKYDSETTWYKKVLHAFPALVTGIVAKSLNNKVFAFIYFSTILDSFVATAFYKSQKSGGRKDVITGGDYVYFVGSTVFSAGVWAVFSAIITIPVVGSLWNAIF